MRIILAAILLVLLSSLSTHGAEPSDPGAPREAMEHWRSLRFGMFIHWGPVALTGHEIGWSRGQQTPIDQYDALYQRFNPEQFDADEWARIAKAAGMKYIIITTKHHDGFCLWPSRYTDYDIGETPFKRDVLKELSEACRKQGIEFGTYYSTCDWWHPAYPKGSPGGKTDKPNPDLDAYMQYLRNQTAELVQSYGPLLTMWFDVPWEVHEQHGLPATLALRKLQPNIVINNRGYMEPSGDYDTPEQRVGGFNRDRPWETCMTICRQWAWKPNDEMKSLQQCVQTLLYTIGGDGNLLFNVGPMPDGRIEPRQVDRLKEMGEWVEAHSQAIYGTRGGPIKPGAWGASTCKDNHVYLFVMNWPAEGALRLPDLGVKVLDAKLLNGGEVTREIADGAMHLSVPADRRDEIATVIQLTVEGRAWDIAPRDAARGLSGSLAYNKAAKASNVFGNQIGEYGPMAALDDDPATRWATDANVDSASLDIDLGEPRTINRLKIVEPAEFQRVKQFQLEYRNGTDWKTCYTGAKIGPNFEATFDPVTTPRVRLRILEAPGGPTLSEVQLFGTKSN